MDTVVALNTLTDRFQRRHMGMRLQDTVSFRVILNRLHIGLRTPRPHVPIEYSMACTTDADWHNPTLSQGPYN